jgi:hypothetical protein
MPGKKSRKDRAQQNRDGGVTKGWHLVQSSRREDPERHKEYLEIVDPDDEAVPRFEVPTLLRDEMTTYQKEVVDWLESAISSWFNFYFALGDGGAQNRLDEASEGLGKATDRLQAIARQMGNLPWSDSQWHDVIMVYAEAVDTWAAALDLIMRGARFDRHRLADEGFEQMDMGTSTAERVVSLAATPEPGGDVDRALRTLARLKPRGRVSPKTVATAKEPWRRAVVAAGSTINWSKSVW